MAGIILRKQWLYTGSVDSYGSHIEVLYQRQLDFFWFLEDISPLIQEASSVHVCDYKTELFGRVVLKRQERSDRG